MKHTEEEKCFFFSRAGGAPYLNIQEEEEEEGEFLLSYYSADSRFSDPCFCSLPDGMFGRKNGENSVDKWRDVSSSHRCSLFEMWCTADRLITSDSSPASDDYDYTSYLGSTYNNEERSSVRRRTCVLIVMTSFFSCTFLIT